MGDVAADYIKVLDTSLDLLKASMFRAIKPIIPKGLSCNVTVLIRDGVPTSVQFVFRKDSAGA